MGKTSILESLTLKQDQWASIKVRLHKAYASAVLSQGGGKAQQDGNKSSGKSTAGLQVVRLGEEARNSKGVARIKCEQDLVPIRFAANQYWGVTRHRTQCIILGEGQIL